MGGTLDTSVDKRMPLGRTKRILVDMKGRHLRATIGLADRALAATCVWCTAATVDWIVDVLAKLLEYMATNVLM